MNIIVQSINSLLRSIQETNTYTLGCLTVPLQKNLQLKKINILAFLLFDSKDKFTIKHETTKVDKQKKNILLKKKRQTGSFLNRYDFAYTGRDTVNQLVKNAPGVIKKASAETNNIAEQRIQQTIS